MNGKKCSPHWYLLKMLVRVQCAYARAPANPFMQIYEYLLNKNVGTFVAQLTRKRNFWLLFRFVNNYFDSQATKMENDGYTKIDWREWSKCCMNLVQGVKLKKLNIDSIQMACRLTHSHYAHHQRAKFVKFCSSYFYGLIPIPITSVTNLFRFFPSIFLFLFSLGNSKSDEVI